MRSAPYNSFGAHGLRAAFLVSSLLALASCSIFNKDSTKSGSKQGAGSGVLGSSLGEYANGMDAAQLNELYAVTSLHAPAPVRPDPDLIVRNLLLQYRETGSTVAREIGRVEEYRMLLGGANVIFTVVPQESYDSTSLLAEMKVAGEICRSLVDPSQRDHPGWRTILPHPMTDIDFNLTFLAQRFLGVPISRIDAGTLENLKVIVNASLDQGQITAKSYVPACTTLILDAEALLL